MYRSGACQGTPHKEKREVSSFEKYVIEGNEKADELAEEGAMLDEGFHGGRESRDTAAGARRKFCSFAVCGQLSLFSGRIEGLRGAQAEAVMKGGLSWTRKERRRNIERSGVLKPISIDARGVEETASI